MGSDSRFPSIYPAYSFPFGSAFSGFYRSKTGQAPIYLEGYLTHIPSYLNNLKDTVIVGTATESAQENIFM
jgi:hypothetical protein